MPVGIGQAAHPDGSVSPTATWSFVDSGSVSLPAGTTGPIAIGLFLIEVLAPSSWTIGGHSSGGSAPIGAAVVVVGNGWSSILSSATNGTLGLAFSASGSTITVTTSGGTSQTINVLSRRILGTGPTVRVF